MAEVAITILAFLLALSFHEFSHGFVAHLLGDDTARRHGRLTLNPLAHIDPFGTVILPLLCIMGGWPVIGWAKPVPFNPHNLRFHKWGSVMVGLAGPASNFLSAAVYLALLKVCLVVLGLPWQNLLVIFLTQLAIVSVALGVFNLIPVPPLDGAALLEAVFDAPRHRRFIYWLETRGTWVVFAFILIDSLSPSPLFGRLLGGAVNAAFNLFGL
jgi:Zn-dependent protease